MATRSLVTGASTGIGFATALRLASEGHEVHASVRSLESGKNLLDAAQSVENGSGLSLLVMDVDSADSVNSAIGSVLAEHGPIDVLVNNAGIAGGAAIEDTPLSEFERVMNTNAWGMLRCIQAVLPTMRERRSGHVVNVTSLAGRVAQGGTAAYTASKWAAEGMAEVLAIEGHPFGIRTSIIEPGVVKTPIFTKGRGAQVVETPYVGAQRLGTVFKYTLMDAPTMPEEVADTIWRVLSNDDAPLRNLVGTDAERLASYRGTITDNDWVARQGDSDDPSFYSWMTEISGITPPAED